MPLAKPILTNHSKRCMKRVAALVAAKQIVIFNLLGDLLDLCAVEKASRVSKAGIVDVDDAAS